MSKKVLVTRTPLGTRRRTLLGATALLAGSALPGWARAAADAAAQAGSGPTADAAGAVTHAEKAIRKGCLWYREISLMR